MGVGAMGAFMCVRAWAEVYLARVCARMGWAFFHSLWFVLAFEAALCCVPSIIFHRKCRSTVRHQIY